VHIHNLQVTSDNIEIKIPFDRDLRCGLDGRKVSRDAWQDRKIGRGKSGADPTYVTNYGSMASRLLHFSAMPVTERRMFEIERRNEHETNKPQPRSRRRSRVVMKQ